MAQTIADKKTMAVCYGKVQVVVQKIKHASEEIEDMARYLETQDLNGGDGDLIVKGIRDGVDFLRAIMAKEKVDLLDVLDEKIMKMKTITSDQGNITSTNRSLKEKASNVASLKR